MDIKWLLTKEQYAAAIPKIKATLRWMDTLGKGASYRFEVKFEYRDLGHEWWMFVNGSGCGATYKIKENEKKWTHL